jgi:hypothetical protein
MVDFRQGLSRCLRLGWASWGETFRRFLPHTPSSNDSATVRRPLLEAGQSYDPAPARLHGEEIEVPRYQHLLPL